MRDQEVSGWPRRPFSYQSSGNEIYPGDIHGRINVLTNVSQSSLTFTACFAHEWLCFDDSIREKFCNLIWLIPQE